MDPSRPTGHTAGLVVAALMLTSCASMNVGSYLNHGIDLPRYQTYNWALGEHFSTGDPRLDNNPFFMERVQADVEKQLASRGFEKVTSGQPDLLLHYHAGINQQIDVSGDDPEYGPCTSCTSSLYDKGSLVLDLVDARTNTLAWRGWAEGGLLGLVDDQKMMEQMVDEAVTRIVATLPRRL